MRRRGKTKLDALLERVDDLIVQRCGDLFTRGGPSFIATRSPVGKRGRLHLTIWIKRRDPGIPAW